MRLRLTKIKLLKRGGFWKAFLVARESDGALFFMKKINIYEMTE